MVECKDIDSLQRCEIHDISSDLNESGSHTEDSENKVCQSSVSAAEETENHVCQSSVTTAEETENHVCQSSVSTAEETKNQVCQSSVSTAEETEDKVCQRSITRAAVIEHQSESSCESSIQEKRESTEDSDHNPTGAQSNCPSAENLAEMVCLAICSEDINKIVAKLNFIGSAFELPLDPKTNSSSSSGRSTRCESDENDNATTSSSKETKLNEESKNKCNKKPFSIKSDLIRRLYNLLSDNKSKEKITKEDKSRLLEDKSYASKDSSESVHLPQSTQSQVLSAYHSSDSTEMDVSRDTDSLPRIPTPDYNTDSSPGIPTPDYNTDDTVLREDLKSSDAQGESGYAEYEYAGAEGVEEFPSWDFNEDSDFELVDPGFSNPLSDVLPAVSDSSAHPEVSDSSAHPAVSDSRTESYANAGPSDVQVEENCVPGPSTGAIPKDWEVIRQLKKAKGRRRKNHRPSFFDTSSDSDDDYHKYRR